MSDFVPFPKLPRLSRGMVVTEKIDGTNASVHIGEDGEFLVGSRTRWITPESDNFGFAAWAYGHRDELVELLGHGTHFGEWWGSGIQRRYGLDHKRFSLFNTGRWEDIERVSDGLVHCVPVLYQGPFSVGKVDEWLHFLHRHGSEAAPGFMKPEGVVVFHEASRVSFKKTLDHNDEHKFMSAKDPRAA